MTERPVAMRSDRGVALVVALMVITVIGSLAAAGLLNASMDHAIAAGYRDRDEARYVLDAALERATAELALVPDWTLVLSGSVRSRFVDGPAGGVRRPWAISGVDARDLVDLDRVVSMAACGQAVPCQPADVDRVTAARPWGSNNPRWQLFGYGPERSLMTLSPLGGRRYVAVLVGDDAAETDSDPTTDGAVGQGGHDIVELQGHVFGSRGLHFMMGLTVARGLLPADYGAGRVRGVRILERKYTQVSG